MLKKIKKDSSKTQKKETEKSSPPTRIPSTRISTPSKQVEAKSDTTSTKSDDSNPERRILFEKDPNTWTTSMVAKWLGYVDMDKYRTKFIEENIAGDDLVEMDDRDLINMQVKLGDRKNLLRKIADLKQIHRKDGGSLLSHTTHSTSSSDSFSIGTDATVKCFYKEDTRVLDSVDPNDLVLLKERIKDEYKENLTIKYRDEDGDLITVSTEKDLHRAYKDGVIRIHLIPNQFLTAEEFAMLESMVDPVVISDKKGNIMFFNTKAEAFFGYSKAKVMGKDVKMLMPNHHAKNHKKYLSSYMKTGVAKIIGTGRKEKAKHKDGSLLPMHLSISETMGKNGQRYFTAVIHPLQEEKSSTSPSPLFAHLDALLDSTIMINEKGLIQFFNTSAEKLFGYGRDEILGQNVNILMPTPFKNEHGTYLANYMASHVAKAIGIGRAVPIQCKDGSIKRCLLKVGESKVDGQAFFAGVLTEESVKKEVKSILEQEREVLDSIVVPAMIIDKTGMIQAFNEKACAVFGYTALEVMGCNISMIVPSPHKEKHDTYINNYLTTHIAKIVGIGRELEGVKKDGTLIQGKLFVTPKSDGDKEFFSGVFVPHN